MNSMKLDLKSIVCGWMVDTIGHFIAGIIFPLATGMLLWLYLQISGTEQEHVKELAKRWSDSPIFQVMDFVGPLLPAVLGGYVAGRVAKTSQVKHAFVVGVLSVLTASLLATIFPSLSWTEIKWAWTDSFYWILYVPSAMFGGYLRVLQIR